MHRASCETYVGQTQPIAALAGRRVAAFCGIGNPAAFRRTLEELGGEIAFWREFPDHHAYSASDRAELAAAIGATNAELVLTTHKDLVKLPVDSSATARCGRWRSKCNCSPAARR